ncbi:prepilin-type N-terminal cleavage/methylation domain-containing protein [Coraliomargarita parva]|uniref:prepilin-type N-terminal cleavage/methylation domain-containing protein n=1 Tax=Coraliomargarita parva TaxID=3014050 RepID=UPI0022B3C743|nr:DUF1559 domain-containing protein [Coraliomargarita parva]
MTNSSSENKRSAGMTLIEILSVIAIVAVLSGILLAVIGGAREKARLAKCSSNLRQLGVAVQLYTSDHQLALPFGYWIAQNSGDAQVWDQFVEPYLGEGLTEVLRCPSDYFAEEDSDFPRRSYAMVRNHQGGVAKTGYMTKNSPDALRLLSIGNPADTIMFTEYSCAKASGQGSDNVIGEIACSVVDTPLKQMQSGNGTQLHDGLFNYLFVDGHVECRSPEDTIGTGTLEAPLGMWTYASDD